jgi:hypothetical protein
MIDTVSIPAALFIAVGRATQAGYAVSFINPEEWNRSYQEEDNYCRRTGQLMEIWQPLADLGWQNFITDGTDILVRFEVIG